MTGEGTFKSSDFFPKFWNLDSFESTLLLLLVLKGKAPSFLPLTGLTEALDKAIDVPVVLWILLLWQFEIFESKWLKWCSVLVLGSARDDANFFLREKVSFVSEKEPPRCTEAEPLNVAFS